MNGQGSSPSGKVLLCTTGVWPGAPLSVPDRRLEAELLDVAELARRAFEKPMEAGIFLQLRRGWVEPDRLRLYTELPWLQRLPDAEGLIKALFKSGWVVLKCGSPQEATRLCASSGSKWVRVVQLGS
ncbi:MAG TPA: hypothetical protein VH394_07700 [Thermoanaerobaculia bacterium]|jgi:hypothetical protein|nr:hypothetical protein [Thermoanaerobaculia bacterium]